MFPVSMRITSKFFSELTAIIAYIENWYFEEGLRGVNFKLKYLSCISKYLDISKCPGCRTDAANFTSTLAAF